MLALTGDDAPPPPRLEGAPARDGAAAEGAGRWHPVAPAGSFVGYRVDERYLGVGVRTAVGRTSAVTGSVTVDGRSDPRGRPARRHDDRALRPGAPRRHPALPRHRDRPLPDGALHAGRARWRSAPARRPATGTLTLHGRRAAIAVTVRGQRLSGGRLELVGSAPIRFAAFAIEPPSVAGLVTVSDHGTLEFRLVLARG